MAEAKRSQQCVDRSHLKSLTTALVAQSGRLDVIAAIGDQEGEGAEASKDRLMGLGPEKALEHLLENEPRSEHKLARLQSGG